MIDSIPFDPNLKPPKYKKGDFVFHVTNHEIPFIVTYVYPAKKSEYKHLYDVESVTIAGVIKGSFNEEYITSYEDAIKTLKKSAL